MSELSAPGAPGTAASAPPVRRHNDWWPSRGQPDAPAASLIDDLSELDSVRVSWDALAVSVRSPFGAPAWARAWWRHLAPDGARLAVVAVHAGDELVGLAPLYSSRRFGVTELRLLSGGFASRLGILAIPGREPEVAAAIAGALADAELRPDIFRWEAVDSASPWPGWLSDNCPDGRVHHIQEVSERSAPILRVGQGSYEEWFAAKSRNFRSRMRRDRRAMERQGATFRCADHTSLGGDLAAFARLHFARWEGRGGSFAVNPSSMAMLEEVGEALVETGRFRLWMIEGPDGEAISAQLFVAAGGEVAYWNGGFDERWGKHSPGTVAILAAIEDAFERGDDLVDLGGGEARYKDRLADEDRPVVWRTSYRRGLLYPLARLRRLPEQVARRGSHKFRERLGPHRMNRLRRLLGH
jgi:CelD/BcsL family acetyltransferase involved in cellulose biosynthesis